MDIKRFKEKPLLGILRGIEIDAVEPLVETVIGAGLEALEVTMNTKCAADIIKKMARVSKGNLMVGAGTVLDMESLKKALDAGATFIVMPTLVEDVLAFCVRQKIPVFPGALTPQEIYRAWFLGSTMVKLFPAKFFGPEYIKEIKAPFDNIEILACGGVTLDNVKDYFSCGAGAVAIGASVFKKEWLEDKDFKSIGGLVSRYVEAMGKMKGPDVCR